MVKITKTGEQYRISLPKEIVELTGWDEKTELVIFPYIKDPDSSITPDTPILIKKIIEKDK
ncbi:MAG: AbrB/MazE/SpoVT family DNA-binding domain-containing protein [Candidatus Methanoperedens sp.]|nr:AbrB/MazE/SpoVT family DNA-binding domain-containing protein [Candidatus Methanoperedens sp.]